MNRKWLLSAVIGASVVAVLFLPFYMIFHVFPTLSNIITFDKEVDAQKVARNFRRQLPPKSNNSGLVVEDISDDLQIMIQDFMKDFDMVKVKIFSPLGEVLYSTDKEDIGTVNSYPYFHEIVANGKSYTKVVQKDEKSLEGQVIRRDVVETYAPLMDSNVFIGALELYYDITYNNELMKGRFFQIQFIVLMVSGLLLATIVLSYLKGRRFYLRTLESEKHLKQFNEELMVLFKLSSAITTRVNVRELLPAVLDTIIRFNIFKIEKNGGVFLVEGKNMEMVCSLDNETEFLQLHEAINVGECLCGKAAETGEIIVSNTCNKDERYTSQCSCHVEKGVDCALVAVPLKNGTEVVGVLFFYTSEVQVISGRKKQLLEAIGSQVGIIIANSRLHDQAMSLSLSDPLTGLSNRRQLDLTLDRQVSLYNRYKYKFSVLIMQVDAFDSYLKHHGQRAGNIELKNIASVLNTFVRGSDFIARYSGEIFVIVLAEASAEIAKNIAGRLQEKVVNETDTTISIGIAGSYDGVVSERILKKAEMALYQARENGKGCVVVAE